MKWATQQNKHFDFHSFADNTSVKVSMLDLILLLQDFSALHHCLLTVVQSSHNVVLVVKPLQ